MRREDFNADNQKIDAALGAGTKIAWGTYVGTGTSGSANPNTLTFDFEPALVIVSGVNRFCIFVRGSDQGLAHYTGSSTYRDLQTVTWEETSLNWYIKTSYSGSGIYSSPAAHQQLNLSGESYYYVAIG